MCLIIDANAASQFSSPATPAASAALAWIKQDGRIALNAKLKTELAKIYQMERLITELARAGKVTIPVANLEHKAKVALRSCSPTSNDTHVLELAIATGARTLFSEDKRLQTDFKSKTIINKPRGRVYTKPTHRRLLDHTASCGYGK